jgi:acyl-CoA thioester hydrolase
VIAMTRDAIKLPQTEVAVVIPFHDVDLMGVAWHGHYAKYFEIARCALLDQISYNYQEMRDSGFAWPIIEMKLRYAKPARFGQKIMVKARLVEYELRLKIDYVITDAESGERLTKGHTIQVAVNAQAEELLLSSPAILYEKLGIAR